MTTIAKLEEEYNCYLIETFPIEKLNKKIKKKLAKNPFNDVNKIIKDVVESYIDEYSMGEKNRCLECNCDMGYSNPRQLCGKYYCHNQF